MKKVWRFLLPLLVCLILPLSFASATEQAADSDFEGQYRDDGFIELTSYVGTLPDDGKLVIPSTWKGVPVKSISALFGDTNLRDSVKEVYLPEGLQELGGVFQDCASLESVYIPSTLLDAVSPFSGCAKLKNVTFGVSLPRVPATLFQGCTGLTEIELPRMATFVGRSAFQDCSNLEKITFNNSNYLMEIQESAFYRCSALGSVDTPEGSWTLALPEGLRTLGESAFARCTALKKVRIPASLKTAGSYASPVFSGCSSLNDVQFGSGVTSIIDNLFAKCDGLKQITIPATIVSIGAGAFGQSGLTSINIPNSVTSYGARAFRNCLSLITAELSGMAPEISNRMFYQCSFLQSVKVAPATVTSIGQEAFYECKRLTELPAWEALTKIGDSAFYWCEELASITLPSCLTSLGSSAFQYDALLNHVVIPSMITEIPSYAFANCYRLADIVIPGSVKTIGDYAFYQDTDLLHVLIPATVISISDQEAFSYVDRMTIEGIVGSYAHDWAKRNGALNFKEAKPIETISLAGGGNSMILPRSCVVAPVFNVSPVDNADAITLTSSDSSVVVRQGYILYCEKTLTSPVTITATATSGHVKPFEFTVTCEDMTALEVVPPEITDYAVGDAIDWTGFVPEAVFKSGARQPIYNYPPSADTIRDKVLEWTASGFESESAGTKTVTVSYGKVSTTFPVQVYATAAEVPVSLRHIERTTNGFRVLTHGVAGNAKLCALFSFDKNNRYLGAAFKTLNAADTAAGVADFAAVPNAASVKAVLLTGDTMAPSSLTKTLSVA